MNTRPSYVSQPDQMNTRMATEAPGGVPGIGPWTARGFLLVALDRPDVFLSGDLALRRAIQRAYGFHHLPTEDEMAQVSVAGGPYRSLAVRYLFASEYEG